jgi:hypothetical protein
MLSKKEIREEIERLSKNIPVEHVKAKRIRVRKTANPGKLLKSQKKSEFVFA